MGSKRLTIITNPAARKSSTRKIERAAGLLGRAGWDVEILRTEARGQGTALAGSAARGGAGLVVAAGGDGTFNEVMNGLAGGGVPMAIIPLGTTNVLAKELKIPEDVEGAVQRIITGRPRPLYVANLIFPAGLSRKFFLMAGIGFDAEAVYNVNRRLKSFTGKAGYLAGGLKVLLDWNPGLKRAVIDGHKFEFKNLIVCKGARYGGYPKAAPDASLETPDLYAVLMRGGRRIDVLRYAFGIITGRHTAFRDVTYLRCRRVNVLDEERIQADGDYIGKSPVTIETSREKILFVI